MREYISILLFILSFISACISLAFYIVKLYYSHSSASIKPVPIQSASVQPIIVKPPPVHAWVISEKPDDITLKFGVYVLKSDISIITGMYFGTGPDSLLVHIYNSDGSPVMYDKKSYLMAEFKKSSMTEPRLFLLDENNEQNTLVDIKPFSLNSNIKTDIQNGQVKFENNASFDKTKFKFN